MSPKLLPTRRHNFFCLYNNSRFLRGTDVDFLPENLPFGYCTHVVYWSFGIDKGVPFSRTPLFDKMYGLHRLRHTVNNSGFPDVKIVLAIGGYSSDQPQFSLLGQDGGMLAQFARDTMQLVRLHSLDGIAIHWREPKPGCQIRRGGDASALRSLFSALRRGFQLNGFPGLLSIIVPTDVSATKAIVDSVVHIVDYVFLDVRQLRPAPSYQMCRNLALEVVRRIQFISPTYFGNEEKFCPALSLAPWLMEAQPGTGNASVPALTGWSVASELGGRAGIRQRSYDMLSRRWLGTAGVSAGGLVSHVAQRHERRLPCGGHGGRFSDPAPFPGPNVALRRFVAGHILLRLALQLFCALCAPLRPRHG
ncbi:hypothetical protein MTO96_012462 [Rhipicephalus appendiculatus]